MSDKRLDAIESYCAGAINISPQLRNAVLSVVSIAREFEQERDALLVEVAELRKELRIKEGDCIPCRGDGRIQSFAAYSPQWVTCGICGGSGRAKYAQKPSTNETITAKE